MMCHLSLFGTIRDKTHVGSYINGLSHVEKYGSKRYGFEPKAAGLSLSCHTLDDEVMLQSYPESPVSPSTSQGVIGSAADPVLVSNSAAQAQSNATSPRRLGLQKVQAKKAACTSRRTLPAARAWAKDDVV